MKSLRNFLNHFFIYYIWLETSMRGNDFTFNCVYLLCYKCDKTNFIKGGLYMNCIKNKKATINPINKDDNKCFPYTVIVALIYDKYK